MFDFFYALLKLSIHKIIVQIIMLKIFYEINFLQFFLFVTFVNHETMAIKKKSYFFCLLGMLILFGGNHKVMAQDPEFSQFYANPLYLNPAFAGTVRCPRVSMVHRNQWPGISGTYVTSAVSYDQHIESISGGLGFMFSSDNAANTLKTNRFSAMYSYQVKVSRKFSLRLAGEAAFFQKSLDWSKLQFGDMVDPRRGFVYQSHDQPNGDGTVSGVDFSAGVLGFSDVFFFGFAAHHLTQPEESVITGQSPLPMKYTAHAGAVIPLAGGASKYTQNDVSISPNIMFRQQGTFSQLNMGIYIKKGPIIGGAWYRNKDSFIVLLGIQTETIKLGYSYDVTVSKLTTATGGAHEVTLGIKFKCRPKRRTFRTISCPSF